LPGMQQPAAQTQTQPQTINNDVNAGFISKKSQPSAGARTGVQARFEYAYGYVPSFGSHHFNKPAQINKPPSGRIDWAAKYARN